MNGINYELTECRTEQVSSYLSLKGGEVRICCGREFQRLGAATERASSHRVWHILQGMGRLVSMEHKVQEGCSRERDL